MFGKFKIARAKWAKKFLRGAAGSSNILSTYIDKVDLVGQTIDVIEF